MKKTGILIWACATHFLVDFICALVITHQIPGTRNWDLLLLAYNFLAFAGQLPLGVLLDLICKKSGKWGYLPAALLGCILCAGALIAGLSPRLLVLSAGLGNALFHLGSGADILRDSRGKSRESGLFVSTGAAGIFFGALLDMTEGVRIAAACAVLVSILVLLFFLLSVKNNSEDHTEVCLENQMEDTSVQETADWQAESRHILIPSFCLFLVVLLRSFEGVIFSFPWNEGIRAGVLLTCGIVLGKITGGFAADRFGSLRTSVVSLGCAAVFLAFSHIPIMGFLGVLLFNMTMPITLTGLFRRFPGNPGLSFGLLTFALYLGYLPVYAGMAENLSRPAVYVFLTLLSLGLMTVSEKGEKSNGG